MTAMLHETRLLMGMPIAVRIIDAAATQADVDAIYAYFARVDDTFSTYKAGSEISKINRGELLPEQYSEAMRTILALSEQTKAETHGYFDIQGADMLDPSGIVKGWAIYQAAALLKERGLHNFYIDAGGDIQVSGTNDGRPWRVGIRNPFERSQHVKVLGLTTQGVATSGSAIRGQHIYDPFNRQRPLQEIVSITVVGPNVYEADRFATAAFAMGRQGIHFIERRVGCEGYMIDVHARATFTSGFERYVVQS